MAIVFSDSSKSSSAVSKLLASVLPGHSAVSQATRESNSQIINTTQKKLKPEEITRLHKKEKLQQRLKARKSREERVQVDKTARYQLLKTHSKQGTLTPEEKIELKKLVKKNVVNVQSWRSEVDEDLKELQEDILALKNTGRVNKRVKSKLTAKELYQKKQQKKFPGLTPGLAPVGLSDSDSDED